MNERAILVARWAMMALFVAMIVATVVATIRFPAYLLDHVDKFTTNRDWSPAQTQEGLRQLGWQADTVGWVSLARELAFALPAIVLFLIIWRRANTWYLVLMAFVFAGSGGSIVRQVLGESSPLIAWWYGILAGLSWQLYFFAFFFFPNGKPVPRWTRWVAAAWGLLILVYLFSPGLASNPVLLPVYIAFVVTAILAQIYRYARRSTYLERQQTKGVVYVLAIFMSYALLIIPFQFRAPTGPDYGGKLLFSLVNLVLLGFGFQLMPIIIALSVLRYRLWDIDVVIRRMLVYAVLSALLALTFYGAVVVFQRLFAGISGQQSTLALVASTLAIAALFSPLRRRVQEFVDRRFYRRKYDAGRVLARFGAIARDETNLEQLTGALSLAIDGTVHPARMGIWLSGEKR